MLEIYHRCQSGTRIEHNRQLILGFVFLEAAPIVLLKSSFSIKDVTRFFISQLQTIRDEAIHLRCRYSHSSHM